MRNDGAVRPFPPDSFGCSRWASAYGAAALVIVYVVHSAGCAFGWSADAITLEPRLGHPRPSRLDRVAVAQLREDSSRPGARPNRLVLALGDPMDLGGSLRNYRFHPRAGVPPDDLHLTKHEHPVTIEGKTRALSFRAAGLCRKQSMTYNVRSIVWIVVYLLFILAASVRASGRLVAAGARFLDGVLSGARLFRPGDHGPAVRTHRPLPVCHRTVGRRRNLSFPSKYLAVRGRAGASCTPRSCSSSTLNCSRCPNDGEAAVGRRLRPFCPCSRCSHWW